MESENLPESGLRGPEQENLQEQERKLKKEQTLHAFLIGISVGTTVFSLVVNGPNFKLLFFVLLAAFFIVRSLPTNEKLKRVRAQIKANTP